MGLDFDFLTSGVGDSDGGGVAVAESGGEKGSAKPAGTAKRGERALTERTVTERYGKADDHSEDGGDARTDSIIDRLDDVLLPGANEAPPLVKSKKTPVGKKETETGGDTEGADGDRDTPAPLTHKKPVRHSAELLQHASAWGIPPDEAERYPTARALLGEIALRDLGQRRAAERQGDTGKKPAKAGSKKAAAKGDDADGDGEADELTLAQLGLTDDNSTPEMRSAMEKILAQTNKVTQLADKRVAQAEKELEALRADHAQAASDQDRETETKIARTIDEEVSEWGAEFAELLGTPSETYADPENEKFEAVENLRSYLFERIAGYRARTNSWPRGEAAAALVRKFTKEARGALWPDMAEKSARTTLSKKLRAQKGGATLRPGVRVDREPAEQGDAAAKAGISEYFSQIGFDPWGGKKK